MNVAIIGLGLMGGSLGLALRERGVARVTGYARRPDARHLAIDGGFADACADSPSAAVAEADIAVFCTPVLTIPALIAECGASFRSGCTVTDVGSTKADVQREAAKALAGSLAVFVGSHPMTGSEKNGLEAARADLYEGAIVAVTPGNDSAATERICRFWQAVGARTVRVEAAEHDALVARTSHLPHLVAALLVSVAGRGPAPATRPFCGPGFRDTTRVAAGSPELWHDIVKTNRDALLAELKLFEAELGALTAMLERDDYEGVRTLLAKGRALRARLLG